MIESASNPTQRSAWDEFRRNERMHRLHNITSAEMDLLARVAAMGEVASPRDFVYVLNTIRYALGAECIFIQTGYSRPLIRL